MASEHGGMSMPEFSTDFKSEPSARITTEWEAPIASNSHRYFAFHEPLAQVMVKAPSTISNNPRL